MSQDYKIQPVLHTYKNIELEIIQDNSVVLEVCFTTQDDIIDSDAPKHCIPKRKQKCKPFPLIGASVYLTVRKTAEDSEALIEKSTRDGIEITDAEQGIVDIEFRPEDTSELEPGTYVYDIKVETLEGRKYTPIKGDLAIIAGVTYSQSNVSTGTGSG